MYTPQPHVNDPSYKVKNTFLEFSIPEDNDGGSGTRRRTRSDGTDLRRSPLVVAAKSPISSPKLCPVDETMQAMPIEEVTFQLTEDAAPARNEPALPSRARYQDGGEAVAQASPGLGRDEPAYVVPTTPSPFLHSAFPPSPVPPFGSYGYGIPEMGLPPAFGTDGDATQANGDVSYDMQDMDGQYMHSMQFLPGMYDGVPEMGLPSAFGGEGSAAQAGGDGVDAQYIQGMQGMQFSPEMYDSNYGAFMNFGWATGPMEGGAGPVTGGMQEEGSLVEPPPGIGLSEVPAPGSPRGSRELEGAPQMAAAPAAADPVKELAAEAPRGGGSSSVEGRGEPQERERPRDVGRRGKGRGRDSHEEERSERRSLGAGSWSNSGERTEVAGGATAPGGADKGGPTAESKDSNADGGVYTTVMLRNIPNKYTREMLIKQLSVDFSGLFDFMYLPIDFKNKCNVGYGFINFRTTEACSRFIRDFHGVDVRKCLPGLNSKKVVEVTPARVQGLEENVRRLRNSPVMNQLMDHPEWMPLLFNARGEEEPFPSSDQPLPPVKPRGRHREAMGRD